MSESYSPIYVVDDDESILEAVGSLVRSAGFPVETFASAQEFLTSPRENPPSCLVLDVQLPGLSGLELQQELTKSDVRVPIIFLTGHGDIPMSVRAMKAGAIEFLTKPFHDEDLLDAIQYGIARSSGSEQHRTDSPRLSIEPLKGSSFNDLHLEEEVGNHTGFDGIVGQSRALRQALQLVDMVAGSDSTVLLRGETGTGKERIARAIHDRSHRKQRPFVKLNCAAIPSGLLESELFGHERGAFTGAITQKIGRFELADGGTLFLDEVGDIPLELQPKLLRALQEREFERLGSTRTKKVDVRLVAATNCNLEEMIAKKEFRCDLYYRLNVFPIHIPPLRERSEDIPLLLQYFTQKYARRMQKEIEIVPAAALSELTRWHWPGNIRELENLVERAVVLTRDSSLAISVPELMKSGANAGPVKVDDLDEQEHIVRTLKETQGRVGGPNGAAARMGLKRTTLITRMKKMGIDARKVA
ncbi:MAG: transcriptional regulator, NifA subfamily, Fis Family [Candidatus Angelobacter sp.]|jgi:DNA-binding NtrC family response regulator|nr:transcriptional regulator, NifA subfamily, Fis Family [Candidatus Angelobacter sp.]